MTLRALLEWIGQDARLVALVLGGPPILAAILGLLRSREAGLRAPWNYLDSALIYAACIPGLMAAVVTVYDVGFAHANLLDLNFVVFLLPIFSMVATLIIVGQRSDFNALPGFGRLSGLMTLIGLTFVVILFVTKTKVFLFFGGSIWTLIAFGAFIFALLKWGTSMAFRPRGAPEPEAPKFPGVP